MYGFRMRQTTKPYFGAGFLKHKFKPSQTEM